MINWMPSKLKVKICSVRGTVKGMKRQATNLEKIFAMHISDKQLVSRIHKEPSKFNNKKMNNSIKKWVKV